MPAIVREACLYLSIAVAIVLALALISFDANDPGWSHIGPRTQAKNMVGLVGAWFADVLLYWFGYIAYLLPPLLIYAAIVFFKKATLKANNKKLLILRGSGFLLFVIAATALASMHFHVADLKLPGQFAGGVVGHLIGNRGLVAVFNPVGATVLLLAILLSAINLATGLSWLKVMDHVGRLAIAAYRWCSNSATAILSAQQKKRQQKLAKKQHQQQFIKNHSLHVAQRKKAQPKIAAKTKINAASSERALREQQLPLFAENLANSLPPVSLLEQPTMQDFGYSAEALTALSTLLEIKLKDFKINAEVVAVQPGPVITRFEIMPQAGTKASRITGLASDLARSMSVVSVRVVEVIPGKSTIGIEIPNEKREIISFSEIVNSKAFDQSKSPLTIGLGKDINGNPIVADLSKMPHLLVAGTTGSGKSVAINAMLLSLLYKATKEQVRMILIDPKMLELNVYEGIPHLLCEVVTDMKDAGTALNWSVGEMERRYQLMSALGVRNLLGFNKKINAAIANKQPIDDPLFDAKKSATTTAPKLTSLPNIVIVVDEFSDLMMSAAGKKAEELIVRLAQKARAAGIHLVLATQRPSVDVVTGLIKANVPTRIAFQVSSRVDSRTILDQMGAEQLLGHGDMLYYQPGVTAIPERVHGAFVSDKEVHNVVDFLKSLGESDYLDEVLAEKAADDLLSPHGEEFDPLYDQAVQVVTTSRKASISYLQRRLRVGYNRAATIVEQLEAEGVISQAQGQGAREVLAPAPPE